MATTRKQEEQIAKYMKALGCSKEEAEDIIRTDTMIEKGERSPYDLDPEKEKMAKKFANAGTRKAPTVYKFDTTEKKRKENPTKANIIAELAEFLEKNSENACENVKITNKERQIAFQVGENCFELTLVQKRAKKS